MRVLVIDDEPDVVETIQRRLEADGYEVLSAYGGKEGLEKTLSERPNLILLDLLLPDVDGYEVLRRLRQSAETKHLPVLILTAKGDTSSILKSQELGVTDYLIKPFDLTELLGLIRKHL